MRLGGEDALHINLVKTSYMFRKTGGIQTTAENFCLPSYCFLLEQNCLLV